MKYLSPLHSAVGWEEGIQDMIMKEDYSTPDPWVFITVSFEEEDEWLVEEPWNG